MVIKCKSNKCLLIHVCSPNLITSCLFMRLLGGWGLPRPGAGGYSGIRFHQAGTNPPEWKSSYPGGLARRRAQRGCPRRCSAAAAGPAPPTPGRTPLLTSCLPRAWQRRRLQRVFPLMFTAERLKIHQLFPAWLFLFLLNFFSILLFLGGWGGGGSVAKPQNYFLAFLN